jgi:GTP cyclohydrolase II
MLRELGVVSVELLTNNPAKEEALRALGVDVVKRIPLLVPTNPHSATYLETKRSRMRHAIPEMLDEPEVPGVGSLARASNDGK